MLKHPGAWQTAPLALALQTSVSLSKLILRQVDGLAGLEVPQPRRLGGGVQVLADADVASVGLVMGS